MLSDYIPQRIVSLQPSATAILECLGKLDSVVACTKYCAEICSQVIATNKIIVADSWTAQCDQITRVRPDLVIASVPYQEKAVSEILKSGARFLGLAPHTLADIYVDIGIIAGLVDAGDRGSEVILRMQNEISKVRRRIASLPRPRVYCEEWGKPLIASQPWVAELVEAAGGEFVGTPGARIEPATVLTADPEVIIFAWCGAGDRVPIEKVICQRAWEKTNAAKHGRVYCVRDDLLNTPAPILVHGLNALAAAIHPEHLRQPSGLRRVQVQGAGVE